MAKANKRISSLQIERWLLGELDEKGKTRLEQALSDESRDSIISEDRTLRNVLFERRPARRFAASVYASAEKIQKKSAVSPIGVRALSLAFITAIAVMIWIVPRSDKNFTTEPQMNDSPTTSPDRAKGLKPQLRIYRKLGSRVELLSDGASVSPGDLLQLGYISAGRPYGIVISVDGAGWVTLHALADTSQPSRLIPGSGEHILPTAYELDRAPDFERFFFLLSNEPIDSNVVLKQVREFAKEPKRVIQKRLPLADRIEQYSLLLLKNPLE